MTSPRALLCVLTTVLILVGQPAGPAFAHVDTSVDHWWQFDPGVWRHGFSAHKGLAEEHSRWHHHHPDASQHRHARFHRELARAHRRLHFHEAQRTEVGDATWYDADGAPGACGKGLHGIYIAHKTWPCGSLVSIRSGDRYLLARVQDRGPYGEGRIVDLSPKAFKMLAPLSQGVIQNVHAVRLEP